MGWPWKSSGPPASGTSAQPDAIGAQSGVSSTYADELRKSAAAAIECGNDRVRFVNDSEEVLSKFQRSLLHFQQQRFTDERQVLESLDEKEALVHFFLDCVRNRFPFRNKVRKLRDDLAAGAPAWDKAFRNHIAHCQTCQTVDLSHAPPPPAPPAPPREKLPIPFFIELLALVGVALPLLALGQGCDCQKRPWLISVGVLLCLPLICFEALWRCPAKRPGCGARRWLLWRLAAGTYAVDVQTRPLCCSWAPSKSEIRKVGVTSADAPVQRACTSYGQWYRCPSIATGATIRRSSAKSDLPESEQKARLLTVTCASRTWTSVSASIEENGDVTGLGEMAKFDGTSLFFSSTSGSESRTWAKVGFWRLEWLRKTLVSLAVLGLLMIVVAAAFHPGVTTECGPKTTERTRLVRTPLRAFFLLDASGSIGGRSWDSEKDATEAIIGAFEEVYQPDASRLHIGVGQFATKFKKEQDITNDLTKVVAATRSMVQVAGGTSFTGALTECQKQLTAYTAAGSSTFDLCILITDGASSEKKEDLQTLLVPTTKLMGIYVGSSSGDSSRLRDLTTCGTYINPSECPYFESAADFSQLQSRARELASRVTTGLATEETERTVTYDCDTPFWTLAGVLLLLPFISWWYYLHRSLPAPPADVAKHQTKDPQRLATAGANEDRKI